MVKWVGPGVRPDLPAFARARGSLCVYRLYSASQDLGTPDAFLSHTRQEMLRLPQMHAAEGYNEAFQDIRDARDRAEFDVRLMSLMESIGRRAVIGSFSTGAPLLDYWHDYEPALRRAVARGHYLGLHEYGGGPGGMKWGVGRNQWSDGQWTIEDACERGDETGWWCLRYRQVLAELERRGIPVPAILITEAGIDQIDPCPTKTRGYKTAAGSHPPHIGDYAAQWEWYTRQLSRDERVAGAVDFGWASEDPQWAPFDLSTDPATLDRHERLQASGVPAQPAPAPAPAPSPAPRPLPNPAPPRVTDAIGVYVIAAPGESAAQMAGRAAGYPDAPYGQRLSWWREIREASGAETDTIRAGRAYRVPWARPVTGE